MAVNACLGPAAPIDRFGTLEGHATVDDDKAGEMPYLTHKRMASDTLSWAARLTLMGPMERISGVLGNGPTRGDITCQGA